MTPFQKRLLFSSSALTGLTGVVYWWMEHMLEPVDPWAVINHPLQPWVLKAHILVAPLLVFAVGLVAADHIWKHLRQSVKCARRSGVATFAVLAPMVVSGYLIQAVTWPLLLTAMVWLHVGAGLAYLGGLGAHHLVLRRLRARCSMAERCLAAGADPARVGAEGVCEAERPGPLVTLRMKG